MSGFFRHSDNTLESGAIPQGLVVALNLALTFPLLVNVLPRPLQECIMAANVFAAEQQPDASWNVNYILQTRLVCSFISQPISDGVPYLLQNFLSSSMVWTSFSVATL